MFYIHFFQRLFDSLYEKTKVAVEVAVSYVSL